VPEFSDWENIEAYVDDVVVKTTGKDQLIADLAETFTNLREFQWKLLGVSEIPYEIPEHKRKECKHVQVHK
jgi:hypothetical protein